MATLDPLVKQQGTILQLIGMGIVLFSARGCTQTLSPIPAAKVLRRTINGDLVDVSYSQFDKYSTEISCKDMLAPALDGIWPGREITIHCIAELIVASGQPITRPAVSGSQYDDGNGFTHYRPVIDVRVVEFQTGTEEWAASVNWKLTCEEK